MNGEQKKLKPFLYIHQPQFEAPVGNMQEIFSIKKEKESKKQPSTPQDQQQPEANNTVENVEEKKAKKKPKIHVEDLKGETGIIGAPIKKNEKQPSPEEVQKTIQQYDEEKSTNVKKQQWPSFQRLKSFKEMNLMERLDYLYHFPRQIPPVPCQFHTDKTVYRGFLIGKMEDQVELRLLDKTKVTVPIKDLLEVRMVGLNR